MNSFLQEYFQEQASLLENNRLLDDFNIRVIDVNSNGAIIQTPFQELNITRVLLDGVECEGNIGVVSGRPLRINLSSCSQEITTNRPRLIIETEDGIIQRDLRSQDLGVGVGAGVVAGGGGTPSLSPFFNDCTLRDDKTGCEIHYVPITINNGLGGEIDVVHDTILGLYWEQSPNTSTMNWVSAQTHCSNLGSDWRLPTLVEMELSLVDIGRSSTPYIIGGSGEGNLFDNVQSSWYWTDTRRSDSEAFVVHFNTGRSNSLGVGVTASSRVLCVKEAPDFDEIWGATQKFESTLGGTGQERISAQFEVDVPQCGGVGTVYDRLTSLCWEQSPSEDPIIYNLAVNECFLLDTGGTGWRLPEKAELMTLLFHNGDFQTASRLNSMGFSNIQDGFHWTSTRTPASSFFSFVVDFSTGHSNSDRSAFGGPQLQLLCVKNSS